MIAGYRRVVMGDYLGSRAYLGACCGCGAQLMSTHAIAYVPTDATRAARGLRHGPACERCATRTLPPTEETGR